MSPSESLHRRLREAGLDFFVSVPCKLLSELLERLAADRAIVYTPVTREEEGLGLLAGAHLAGRQPAIVMQNSGFGNSVNATLSLLNYYRMPVVFVVSHRGSPGEPIAAQHAMGGAIAELFRVAGVQCSEIASPAGLDRLPAEVARARAAGRSAAFLFPFAFWGA